MPHLELNYPRPDIAVVTLNRPEKLNALSYELVETLHATIDEIDANNECRVVVLTGAGRGFCSGLDLTDPNPSGAGDGLEFPRSGMRWQERIADLTARIHRLRQPVIAAVNGPAYGGGLGIAAGLRHQAGQRVRAILHAIHQARPRRLRHRRQLHAPTHHRSRPGVRLDPDGARSRRRRGTASRPRHPAVGRLVTRRRRPRVAETLCSYGKFGLESTKQVLWANLEASSLESALHVENRSQILSSTSGEMGAASEAFRHRQR